MFGIQATSASGNIYNKTEGTYIAILDSLGADTSQFGGTSGAYINFGLDVSGGTTVSFDWAFLARDYYPFQDFAFLFAQDNAGNIEYFEKLAEIRPVHVPEPSTLLFVGAGLPGVGLLRKSFKK